MAHLTASLALVAALALAGCSSAPEPASSAEEVAEVICGQIAAGVDIDDVAMPDSDLTAAEWDRVPDVVDERCLTDYAD